MTRPPFTYDSTYMRARITDARGLLIEIQSMLQCDAAKGAEFSDRTLRADSARYGRAATEVSKAINSLFSADGLLGLVEGRGEPRTPLTPVPVHAVGE